MKINSTFFQSLEDSEGMKRLNSYLLSLLEEIKENKLKLFNIICLYAIKKVASHWIIWEKISPKTRKFLRRLFKVVRHYIFHIEKEFHYEYKKDYLMHNTDLEPRQFQDIFEAMISNSSFSTGNPLKMYKLKSQIF